MRPISRHFKGIWIPKEIWLANDLTCVEKCLYAEIHSLDGGEGCTASNAYFAVMFQTTPATIANMLTKLRAKGYILANNFDGKTRTLRTAPEVMAINPGVNRLLTQGLKGEGVPNKKERNKSTAEPSAPASLFPDLTGKELPPEALKWNQVCGSISKVMVVTNGRLKHLKARRRDPFWTDHFEEALAKVAKSTFCCGQNDRGWRATFDWLVNRDGAMANVVEGKYDNRVATHKMNLAPTGSCNL